jgi:hypothetical protein
MATASKISLAKFSASVQTAVKSAMAKHPKFKGDVPNAVSVCYLIRGIPPVIRPGEGVTLGELQAYADDVAANLAQAHPELLSGAGSSGRGAVISVGGHLIIGIPPITEVFDLEQ